MSVKDSKQPTKTKTPKPKPNQKNKKIWWIVLVILIAGVIYINNQPKKVSDNPSKDPGSSQSGGGGSQDQPAKEQMDNFRVNELGFSLPKSRNCVRSGQVSEEKRYDVLQMIVCDSDDQGNVMTVVTTKYTSDEEIEDDELHEVTFGKGAEGIKWYKDQQKYTEMNGKKAYRIDGHIEDTQSGQLIKYRVITLIMTGKTGYYVVHIYPREGENIDINELISFPRNLTKLDDSEIEQLFANQIWEDSHHNGNIEFKDDNQLVWGDAERLNYINGTYQLNPKLSEKEKQEVAKLGTFTRDDGQEISYQDLPKLKLTYNQRFVDGQEEELFQESTIFAIIYADSNFLDLRSLPIGGRPDGLNIYSVHQRMFTKNY